MARGPTRPTATVGVAEHGSSAVPLPIASIAIRVCPELPPTTEERIADNGAQTVADAVMYREALAAAAALAATGRRTPRPTAG